MDRSQQVSRTLNTNVTAASVIPFPFYRPSLLVRRVLIRDRCRYISGNLIFESCQKFTNIDLGLTHSRMEEQNCRTRYELRFAHAIADRMQMPSTTPDHMTPRAITYKASSTMEVTGSWQVFSITIGQTHC